LYHLRVDSITQRHFLVTHAAASMPNIKLRQDIVRTVPYVGEGRSQCIYWDNGLPGFGLRVFATGLRTYVCAYRLHRRRRIASLGRATLLTLDEARKKAVRYLGLAASNSDPQAEADALSSAITVSALIKLYVENHAKKKKKTWKQDESYLQRWLEPKFGTRPVTTLTSADIERIHTDKGTDHPHAANSFIEVVRKMFNWARTAGKVPREFANPGVGIVRFPQVKRKRFVTTVEMPRLLAAIDTEDEEYARHAIWLLLLTGLRLNELLKAKWSDVDWDFRTLFVGLTKNGEPVLAPLSDAAIKRLQQVPRLETNVHIVCGKKPGTHLVDLHPAWYRIRKTAQMEDVRLHDLRRTVGSWLVQHGESLHLVGQILNHKDPKTTAGYAYFQTQQRERALTAHGQKILKFAPAVGPLELTPPEVYEARTTAVMPSTDPAAPKRRSHYVERDVLYRLVWEAPVSEVATRFGVSDVGLAKACRPRKYSAASTRILGKDGGGHFAVSPAAAARPNRVAEKIRIRGSVAPVCRVDSPAVVVRPAAFAA
jgi:integrase